jgi:hypothetical protein
MRVHAVRDSADLGPQRLPRQSSYRACPEEKIASWLHSRRGRQGGRHRWVVGSVGRGCTSTGRSTGRQAGRSGGHTPGRTKRPTQLGALPFRFTQAPFCGLTVMVVCTTHLQPLRLLRGEHVSPRIGRA